MPNQDSRTMKRALENPNNEDAPPINRRRLSFKDDPKYCDVTFCISFVSVMNNQSKSVNNNEIEDIDIKTDQNDSNNNENDNRSIISLSEASELKEYPCHKVYFAENSTYFKAILYVNANITIKDKITLKDLNCNTFEFIKKWCYNKNPILDKNNVLYILVASHKYDITKLELECINFIKNDWITSGFTFNSFLTDISNFDDRYNNQSLFKI